MSTQTERKLTMMDCEYCFAVPGEDSIIDVINPITGNSWINGETLEQVRARYPGAVKCLFDDFCEDVANRNNPPLTWIETTEDHYYEMLGVLPPARMTGYGF